MEDTCSSLIFFSSCDFSAPNSDISIERMTTKYIYDYNTFHILLLAIFNPDLL